MTFIHIYRDSTDPCEEEEEGDGEAGGLEGGDDSFLSTSSISMCSWLCNRYSLTQEEVWGEGGDLSRWTRLKDSREEMKKKQRMKKKTKLKEMQRMEMKQLARLGDMSS